jgi:DNA-binding NarL/FixJ family response regulator
MNDQSGISEPADPIRLVIIDDHPLWREGVISTLQADAKTEPAIRVVGEGASADEALQLALSLLPDILLLDLTLPGGGLNAARAVSKACPITKIVMLTFSEQEDDVLAALKSGAQGYILKGVSGRELRQIVRAIYGGEVYVAPALAAAMLREMASGQSRPPDAASLLEELTPREHQILELVASGRSNKEIGGQLELTEKTIKHYMTNILQKLQVRNRVEAALLAQKAATGQLQK